MRELIIEVRDDKGRLVEQPEPSAPTPRTAVDVRPPQFEVGDVLWRTLKVSGGRVRVRVEAQCPGRQYEVVRVYFAGRTEATPAQVHESELSR